MSLWDFVDDISLDILQLIFIIDPDSRYVTTNRVFPAISLEQN